MMRAAVVAELRRYVLLVQAMGIDFLDAVVVRIGMGEQSQYFGEVQIVEQAAEAYVGETEIERIGEKYEVGVHIIGKHVHLSPAIGP